MLRSELIRALENGHNVLKPITPANMEGKIIYSRYVNVENLGCKWFEQENIMDLIKNPELWIVVKGKRG